jgi:cobalt-zinc-cadmium efflux system outer membrane protein
LLSICTVALPQNAAPPNSSITLNEAFARTLAQSPELVAAGFELAAAEGRLEQSRLVPNPELGVALQDFAGTDAYRSLKSAETTVTLGWVLERGVRPRLVDAAQADVSLHAIDAELARLDVAAETARRFLVCIAFRERLARARQQVALARDAVELVAERVAAGSVLAADLARAEADLVRAELLEEDYEHELLSALHRLSAQWGSTTPEFATVSGEVFALPALEPFEALRARAASNPELRRLMSVERVNEAEVRLAEARSKPAWHASFGLRRYESTDDVAIVGGLTVPLPIRNRNQGVIAAARATAAATRAEAAASRVRVETGLFVLHQELNHDLQFAGRMRGEVIPRLQSALDDTRRAYDTGRSNYSEWRVVQLELLAAQDDLLEASIDAHRLVIEIERLTGVSAAPASPAQ